MRILFREYASTLSFDLGFQNFERELADLPGEYSTPRGALYLATAGLEAAGCVGLRPMLEETAQRDAYCEMKRLYVRPQFRGCAIGRQLVKSVIACARSAGYTFMRLDTIRGQMGEAVALYRQFGFYEIEAYRFNPIPDALYMELNLNHHAQTGESK